MEEFRIESATTESELLFSGIQGDYFTVSYSSKSVTAHREVWAYTDAHRLADFFEWMASQPKPWEKREGWESIEGEFEIYARCSALGSVTFEVELNNFFGPEEWRVKVELKAEFGQLPSIANRARGFFGPSPS